MELERRVKLLDANYETYAKGLEQARIDDALKNGGLSNLSVVQTPSFVPKPAVPKKGLTLLLAFFAAIGGAIGVVLLSDFLDESIHSAAGAERHLKSQSVRHSAAPCEPTNRRYQNRLGRMIVGGCMSNFTLNKPAPNERHVTNGQPATGLVRFPQTNELPSRRLGLVDDGTFNNGIRTFYRQLGSFRSQDGKPIQTLGLTSCYQHEGKSTVGECLASIAAESQRVLFIDANEPLLSIHKALRDEAHQPTANYRRDARPAAFAFEQI